MGPSTQFFTTTDGARIAYATLGQGPPLVHLPPFLSHLDLMWDIPAFRSYYEALAAHFTLVRYDRYGCGLSGRDRTDFTYDVDVRVLAELVDHLRLPRVALLGASAGGPIALRYAAQCPRRVSHLLLIGTQWRPTGRRLARTVVNQLMNIDGDIGNNAYADLMLPGADPETLASFARLTRGAASFETAVGLSEANMVVDLTELLPRIVVPTLVMNPRGDRNAALDNARELADRIPGARFVVLPGEMHVVEFGDPGAIVRAIQDFIGSAPVPSGAL